MTTITARPPDSYTDDVREVLRETPATDSHQRLARFVAALAPADVPDTQLGAHLAEWLGTPSRADELAVALQGAEHEPSAAALRRAVATLRAGTPRAVVAADTGLPAETVGQLATWLRVADMKLTL